ncbi:MAG: hypothetical protein JSV09_02980, partial [Thermoplasmata archaeon]
MVFTLDDISSFLGMYACSKCGAFNGADATHCSACGTKRPPKTDNVVSKEGEESRMSGKSSADELLESSSDIFLCNNCGAFINSNAERCGVCGTEMVENEDDFEDEIDGEGDFDEDETSFGIETEDLLSNQGMILLCSECGAFLGSEATKCGICGIAVEDMKAPEIEEDEEVASADSRLFSDGVLFICEECGAFLKQDSEECTICGTEVFQEVKFIHEEESLVKDEIDDLISEEI